MIIFISKTIYYDSIVNNYHRDTTQSCSHTSTYYKPEYTYAAHFIGGVLKIKNGKNTSCLSDTDELT